MGHASLMRFDRGLGSTFGIHTLCEYCRRFGRLGENCAGCGAPITRLSKEDAQARDDVFRELKHFQQQLRTMQYNKT